MKKNVIITFLILISLIVKASTEDSYLYLNDEGNYSISPENGYKKIDIKHALPHPYTGYSDFFKRSINNPGMFIQTKFDSNIDNMKWLICANYINTKEGLVYDSKEKIVRYVEKEEEVVRSSSLLVSAIFSFIFSFILIIIYRFNDGYWLKAVLTVLSLLFAFATIVFTPFIFSTILAIISSYFIVAIVFMSKSNNDESKNKQKFILRSVYYFLSVIGYFLFMHIGI